MDCPEAWYYYLPDCKYGQFLETWFINNSLDQILGSSNTFTPLPKILSFGKPWILGWAQAPDISLPLAHSYGPACLTGNLVCTCQEWIGAWFGHQGHSWFSPYGFHCILNQMYSSTRWEKENLANWELLQPTWLDSLLLGNVISANSPKPIMLKYIYPSGFILKYPANIFCGKL